MKKLLIIASLSIAFLASCKKETNIYYPESTQIDSTALNVLDKNYAYTKDFTLLKHTKSPLNESLTWHIQEAGGKDVYIINSAQYPALNIYFWRYEDGTKIEKSDLWELLNSNI